MLRVAQLCTPTDTIAYRRKVLWAFTHKALEPLVAAAAKLTWLRTLASARQPVYYRQLRTSGEHGYAPEKNTPVHP